MDANCAKPKTVPCPEIVNSTARLSPFNDFVKRTMSSIEGLWAKLNYIRELRREDGSYEHWGFARVHGEAACQQTIADIHSQLALELLRTSMSQLSDELRISANNAESSPRQLAQALYQDEERLMPKDLCGGSRSHVHSVLLAARLLSCETSTGQNRGSEPGSVKV